jgi:hypothetical protein
MLGLLPRHLVLTLLFSPSCSGRSPFRDCITGANEQQPFPAITPTVALQAKKKGYRTLMIG